MGEVQNRKKKSTIIFEYLEIIEKTCRCFVLKVKLLVLVLFNIEKNQPASENFIWTVARLR